MTTLHPFPLLRPILSESVVTAYPSASYLDFHHQTTKPPDFYYGAGPESIARLYGRTVTLLLVCLEHPPIIMVTF